MPPDQRSDMVPGRDCGSCTVCCSVLTVDTPEFKKLQGVTCLHCLPDQGCAIYLTRFPVCRTWFCQWRRYAWLDDSWRPDRSRFLLLRETDDDVPGGHASPSAPCSMFLALVSSSSSTG